MTTDLFVSATRMRTPAALCRVLTGSNAALAAVPDDVLALVFGFAGLDRWRIARGAVAGTADTEAAVVRSGGHLLATGFGTSYPLPAKKQQWLAPVRLRGQCVPGRAPFPALFVPRPLGGSGPGDHRAPARDDCHLAVCECAVHGEALVSVPFPNTCRVVEAVRWCASTDLFLSPAQVRECAEHTWLDEWQGEEALLPALRVRCSVTAAADGGGAGPLFSTTTQTDVTLPLPGSVCAGLVAAVRGDDGTLIPLAAQLLRAHVLGALSHPHAPPEEEAELRPVPAAKRRRRAVPREGRV